MDGVGGLWMPYALTHIHTRHLPTTHGGYISYPCSHALILPHLGMLSANSSSLTHIHDPYSSLKYAFKFIFTGYTHHAWVVNPPYIPAYPLSMAGMTFHMHIYPLSIKFIFVSTSIRTDDAEQKLYNFTRLSFLSD